MSSVSSVRQSVQSLNCTIRDSRNEQENVRIIAIRDSLLLHLETSNNVGKQ